MKLTKNFSLVEFLESVFYDDDQQELVYKSFDQDSKLQLNVIELAQNLQVLRDKVAAPISINIAYRPKWYELLMGRSGNSKHTLGMAADIKVKGMRPKEVNAIIENLIKEGKMKEGGLGLYKTFNHYDIRGTKARW